MEREERDFCFGLKKRAVDTRSWTLTLQAASWTRSRIDFDSSFPRGTSCSTVHTRPLRGKRKKIGKKMLSLILLL